MPGEHFETLCCLGLPPESAVVAVTPLCAALPYKARPRRQYLGAVPSAVSPQSIRRRK